MTAPQFLFSSRRAHFAVLIALIAGATALRLGHFSGFIGLDDAEYARIAYQLANGSFSLSEYRGPPVFPLRVGVTFPASIAFRLFGATEWSMAVYPLLLSILSLPLIYICAASLFSHRVGLVAASILAIIPVEMASATKLLADLPAAFFGLLGLTLIFVAARSSTARRSILFWSGLLAGISFGLSWLCKETIAYLAPFCLAYMVMSIKNGGRNISLLWAGVTVGSVGTLVGEMIAYYSFAGDFLFRFHEVERNYRQLQSWFFTEGSRFGWHDGESHSRAIVKRVLVTGPAILLLDYDWFLLVPLIGLVAVFHGQYSRDKSFVVPSLWLVTLLLMFNFSSSSLASYMPLTLFQRYCYPVAYASIVLASALIEKLALGASSSPQDAASRERRFWGIALAVALFLMGAYSLQSSLRSSPSSWAAEVRSLRSVVDPQSPLYTDTLSIRGLEFFWNYPEATKWTDFSKVSSAEEIRTGSLVLINKPYIEWLDRSGGLWFTSFRRHGFYEAPPSSWKRIWHQGNAQLYRVE